MKLKDKLRAKKELFTILELSKLNFDKAEIKYKNFCKKHNENNREEILTFMGFDKQILEDVF